MSVDSLMPFRELMYWSHRSWVMSAKAVSNAQTVSQLFRRSATLVNRRLASEDFGRIEEGRHGFWTTCGPQTRKFPALNGVESPLDQDFTTDLTTETMSLTGMSFD